jgi:hypothetical protein
MLASFDIYNSQKTREGKTTKGWFDTQGDKFETDRRVTKTPWKCGSCHIHSLVYITETFRDRRKPSMKSYRLNCVRRNYFQPISFE